MAWPGMILILYGVMDIALGIYGFVHSHSTASLIAGNVAGVLAICAAALAKTHPNYGYGLGAVICIMMLGRFGPQLGQPGWLPATMVITSAIVLIALIAAHFMAAKPAGQ